MTRRARRAGRGAALIELVAVLWVCVPMLVAILYLGRMALHGAVLDRAASDAARYLATLPPEELRDSARRAVALASAQAMLEQALQASGLPLQDLQVEYQCGPNSCNLVTASNPLASMTVVAVLQYRDSLVGVPEVVELRAQAEAGRDN
ncbi:TadE/TadG family type IV pilus assembly protein [Massilia sp. SR12]